MKKSLGNDEFNALKEEICEKQTNEEFKKILQNYPEIDLLNLFLKL